MTCYRGDAQDLEARGSRSWQEAWKLPEPFSLRWLFSALKASLLGPFRSPGTRVRARRPGCCCLFPGRVGKLQSRARHSLSCSFGLKRHSGQNPPLHEVRQVCLVAHGPDDLPGHIFPNAFSNPELARWQMGRVTMLVPRAPSLPAPGFNTVLTCGRPSGPRASHTPAAAESRCHCSTVALPAAHRARHPPRLFPFWALSSQRGRTVLRGRSGWAPLLSLCDHLRFFKVLKFPFPKYLGFPTK